MKLRLLISGSKLNINTIGSFISCHFDSSVDFEILSFHDQFSKLIRTPLSRILYHFFPLLVIRRMDKLFLSQVDSFKPKVVLIFKGMEISKWSLKRVKSMGIVLVNYNLDHPFKFESLGSGNRFVREAIPYYDLHVTYSRLIERQLKDRFHVKTSVLPFGYQLSDLDYKQLKYNEEIVRVCFIGNPDAKRVSLIRFLAEKKIKIDVYGYKWNRFLKESEYIRLFDQVHGFEYWKTLAQYRVQLNILREQNAQSHNMRTFEVPAAGGIMLTQRTAEQAEFFEPGKEIFFYDNQNDTLSQCKMLLNLDKVEAENIRRAAREKSVKMDYSYKRRAIDLVALLKRAAINTP